MTGRKRLLLVDPPGTPGAMLSVVVQPAASQDRDGAAAVLAQAAAPTTRVQQRWAAAAERGALARWVTAAGGWTIAIEPRAPATVGCAVQPRRWVGDRTCGWLGRCQRLRQDYAAYPATSATGMALAMCALLLRRLCPPS